jgi:hypothetical protein
MKPREGRGVTRWRRSAMVAIPSAAIVGGLAVALVNGALVSAISLTNTPFTITSDAFGSASDVGVIMNTQNVGGTTTGATEVGVTKAGLDGVCVQASQSFTVGTTTFGPYYLTISTPSSGATPATLAAGTAGDQVSNLILNSKGLTTPTNGTTTGSFTLEGSSTSPSVIGQDASTITAGGITGGATGAFGLDSPSGAQAVNLDASAYDATVAGTFALPNLTLGISTTAPANAFTCS